MSLKTSFYSKSIIKSDLRRFWWISLLETITLFLVCTLPLWYRVTNPYNINQILEVDRIVTWQNLQFVLPCAFSVAVVSLLFSYMHQVASVSFHHSIPVTRKSLFVSKIVSSLILTILPILINTLMMLAICQGAEIPLLNKFQAPINWLYTGILYTLLMVSLSVFVNMMTGTPIGTVIFTLGFIFLPAIVISFYEFFANNEVYGFYWEASYSAIERIYITDKNLISFSYSFIYYMMIAVFFALAYLLYKKRKLEANGEVIAFTWLKPVFITIIAVISSMVGYSYFGGMFRNYNMFYLIPIGLLGTVIAWMVSRKSISPKGILKPISIYILSALALIGFVHFDISGFERRLPDAEDVLWVDVIGENRNYPDYLWIDNQKIKYTQKGLLDTKIYDEKGIADVIAMHRYSVENQEKKEHYAQIPIKYKLKNGKTLVRKYRYDFEKDLEVLKPVYESKEVRAKRFTLLNGAEKNFKRMNITDRRVKDGITLHEDDSAMQRIIDALIKDLSLISYENSMISSGGSIHIGIYYKNLIETDFDISNTKDIENYTGRNEMIVINDSYQNTLAVLDEIGFLDKIPTSDDIKECTVSVWRNNKEEASVEARTYDIDYLPLKENDGIKVTNRDDIDALYEIFEEIITDKKYTDYNNCINVRIVYKTSDYEFEASCSYDEDKLPIIIKKYM